MRVKLVVTGSLEKRALHRSLERMFPTTGDGQSIEFLRPSKFQGPTCNRLPELGERIPELVRTFTEGLVAEVVEGSDREGPPDLVVGVDDLELSNLDQPGLVTAWIQRGVEDYFVRNHTSMKAEERWRDALRARCSFHLLVPMPEAYFFGERAALIRAEVASSIQARVCSGDLEAFEADDPEFTPNNPEHRRHPKKYLEDLLRRSGHPQARPYRENLQGVRALEVLAWDQLTKDDQTLAFARALFEDLSDAFGVPNPLGSGRLAAQTYPKREVDRSKILLRNL